MGRMQHSAVTLEAKNGGPGGRLDDWCRVTRELRVDKKRGLRGRKGTLDECGREF
jgi:hypothetical protein